MHDPKIIEVMARAIGSRLVLRGSVNDAATDALRALCAARPDVAAILRGEAVAVPKALLLDVRDNARHLNDMAQALAASPWAQKQEAARDE